jgi:cell division protein FtsW
MNKKIGNLFKGDKVIWMVLLFLCLISIVEVFSASSSLTYKSQNYLGPIVSHSWKIFVGVGVAIVILNIPCRFFKLMTPALLTVSVVMLLWVLFFGEKTNDAGRWISLFGLKFQPSEIAKGTMVLVTAQILSAMQREDGADKRAFKFILMVVIPIVLLIGLENLSTAALIMVVIFLMMFIGRVPLIQLGKMLGASVVVVALLVGTIYMVGSLENNNTAETQTESIASKNTKKSSSLLHRFATWKGRIDKKLNSKYVAPQDYDLDKDAQVAHANIAIVNSNIIGRGPGQSVERDFLPQAFSDFIYVIIIEELGIMGATFVVLLYIVLLFRSARIATRCENNFPAFLILGLAMMLVIQATFNMLVAVGIAPVTGQPLPLISRGGTSTIINCAYIGAILSVSRSAKKKTENLALKEI